MSLCTVCFMSHSPIQCARLFHTRAPGIHSTSHCQRRVTGHRSWNKNDQQQKTPHVHLTDLQRDFWVTRGLNVWTDRRSRFSQSWGETEQRKEICSGSVYISVRFTKLHLRVISWTSRRLWLRIFAVSSFRPEEFRRDGRRWWAGPSCLLLRLICVLSH